MTNFFEEKIKKAEELLAKERNLNQISFYEGYLKGLKFIASHDQRLIDEILGWCEEKHNLESDYRDNDYVRGMEAGKNYCLDDLISYLNELKKGIK